MCTCTVVQYYGADLAFYLSLYFHLVLDHNHNSRRVSCVAEDDGVDSLPVRVGQLVTVHIGQLVRRLRGARRELSFVEATRWITQPVGWWGLELGGRHARWSEKTPRLWSCRIHAGLA